MNGLGVRTTTKELIYAITTGTVDQPQTIVLQKLKAPTAFEVPHALAWYRESFLGICQEYNVQAVVIRTAESSRLGGGSGAIYRNNIEGVLAEAAAAESLSVKMGPFATIGSLLNIKKPKQALEEADFKSISEWSKANKDNREALMASVAALRLLEGK
ncbi:hypothetical protein LOY85_16120 [Brevibacillus brevis]|uniref:hypothetical protein n=1 Tax=Brevibacillus brevis TaxID=1393 RepID=UPI001F196292|nr:hypothetical protein [Brevibacillus brevis]UIO40336.1 hypothetical protein LOY85_16120 [Brevibacillus brevis]